MSYTFGIELEIVGMSQDAAARVLRNAGIAAQSEHYNHSTRGHWKVTTDASVHGRGGGCEVVSPILNTDDLTEMQRAVRALHAAGGRVNSTTGTHVHIGAGDMEPTARALMFANWRALHDATDLLVAQSRREGGAAYRWCKRYDASTAELFQDELACGNTRLSQDRYRSLNVVPLSTYGTFEVRLHQGSLNASKLSAWVRYIAAHADAAAAGYSAPSISGLSLHSTDMAVAWAVACGNLAQQSAGYLLQRAAEFADGLTPSV